MECSRRLWASGIGMMGKSDLVRPGLRGVEYAESESAQQVSSRVLAVTGQSSGYLLLERSVARGVLGQASGRHPRVAGWGSCLSRGGGHRENPRALLTAPSGAGRLQAWPELGPHAPCPGEPSRCPFCCLRLGLVLGTFMPSARLCPQHSQPRGRRVRSSLSETFGAIQLFFGEGRGWWPRSGGRSDPPRPSQRRGVGNVANGHVGCPSSFRREALEIWIL